jgi:outer membrane protein assembly factor BamB
MRLHARPNQLNRPITVLTLLAIASITLGSACDEPTRPGQGKVRERWFQAQAFGYPYPAPLVDGSTVYFASGGGSVIARDLQTGVAKWTTSIGQSIYAASAEIGGENFILRSGVLVTAVQLHTSALDAATGREIWRYHAPLDTIDKVAPRPGSVVVARIAADEHTVFIPAWGATVSAVDIHTGQPEWVWRVEPTLQHRSGSYGVRISGDTVFATVWHFLNQSGTQSEAWLVALDKQTGQEFWRVVFPHEGSGTMINCAPALWHNFVIVTLVTGDLFAVDRSTQRIAWRVLPTVAASGLGTALITGAEVYDDFVYANGSDQKIHAYRAADGREVWATDVGQLGSDLSVSSKFVYASNAANLHILDRATGARYSGLEHPRKSTNYAFTSPPTVANRRVFATISDGAWSFDEP